MIDWANFNWDGVYAIFGWWVSIYAILLALLGGFIALYRFISMAKKIGQL